MPGKYRLIKRIRVESGIRFIGDNIPRRERRICNNREEYKVEYYGWSWKVIGRNFRREQREGWNCGIILLKGRKFARAVEKWRGAGEIVIASPACTVHEIDARRRIDAAITFACATWIRA